MQHRYSCIALVGLISIATLNPVAATAADQSATLATSSTAQCEAADKKMMAMANSAPTIHASGNLDSDYMAMTAAQARMMEEAAHLEMVCGKKPHVREMAAALSRQNLEILRNLQIGNGSTH